MNGGANDLCRGNLFSPKKHQLRSVYLKEFRVSVRKNINNINNNLWNKISVFYFKKRVHTSMYALSFL